MSKVLENSCSFPADVQPTRLVVKILLMDMLPTPEAEITDLLFQTELKI